MHPSKDQPAIHLMQTPEYRENYANSVQIRLSIWDFFLTFGTAEQTSLGSVTIRNYQGVYLTPQQAKALLNVLQQNVSNYETTFGEIQLGPWKPGESVQ